MLVISQLPQDPAVERLIQLWSDRYAPDFSALSLSYDSSMRNQLRAVASRTGRMQTVAKLPEDLIEERCKLAAIRVNDLYSHLPEACDLREALQLAKLTSQIYLELLEVYQVAPAITTSSREELRETFGDSPLAAWGIPKVEKLAHTLQPLLLQFQEHYLLSKDWRALGFITTQINFSNALLLEELTLVEQVLINTYFAFLEEQVALPWQRMCAAAVNHDLDSPIFVLVEQMLPLITEISVAVYERLCESYPNHYSRRGRLNNSSIRHSFLRDLAMFQSYLWLSVLQGSSKAIEQELLALCVMVLECVGVSWSITIRGVEFLVEEIMSRLEPDPAILVKPYATGMVQAFQNKQVGG